MCLSPGGEFGDIGGEFSEGIEGEGLLSVGECLFRVGVSFDHDAVCAGDDGGSGDGRDGPIDSDAVGGVGDDGEMGVVFDDGDSGDVEGISGHGFEGADAAFAEDDVVVTEGEEVFGGHEQFLDGGGHAAFEEDGFSESSGSFEEGEVLHVAGADLENVGGVGDSLEGVCVHDLGDDSEVEEAFDFDEDIEPFLFEAAEGVGGGSGLECAAAEEFCASGGDEFGGFQGHFVVFDGAGPGDDGAGPIADLLASDVDDGGFGFDFAADEFVGFGDGDALADAGQMEEGFGVDGALVSGDADGGAHGSGDFVGDQAQIANALANPIDVSASSALCHQYQHQCLRSPCSPLL